MTDTLKTVLVDVCRKCSVILTEDNWFTSYRVKSNRVCQPCEKARKAAYSQEAKQRWGATSYANNRESLLQHKRDNRHLERDRRARNIEKYREADRAWEAANREKVREKRSIWRANNLDKVAAKQAHRHAMKLNQTPADADLGLIAEVYAMAARLTKITGQPYHVDHIEPLSLGGLHHQDNLVVMTGPLNLSKGANHWPWLTWFNREVAGLSGGSE